MHSLSLSADIPVLVLPSLVTSGVGIRGRALATLAFKPFSLESKRRRCNLWFEFVVIAYPASTYFA